MLDQGDVEARQRVGDGDSAPDDRHGADPGFDGRLDRMDDDRSTVAQRGEQLVARAVPARALPGGQHDAHCCPASW